MGVLFHIRAYFRRDKTVVLGTRASWEPALREAWEAREPRDRSRTQILPVYLGRGPVPGGQAPRAAWGRCHGDGGAGTEEAGGGPLANSLPRSARGPAGKPGSRLRGEPGSLWEGERVASGRLTAFPPLRKFQVGRGQPACSRALGRPGFGPGSFSGQLGATARLRLATGGQGRRPAHQQTHF